MYLVFGPSVAVGFAGLVLGGLGWFLVRVSWRHGRIPRGEHLLGTKWDPGVPCVLLGKACLQLHVA